MQMGNSYSQYENHYPNEIENQMKMELTQLKLMNYHIVTVQEQHNFINDTIKFLSDFTSGYFELPATR